MVQTIPVVTCDCLNCHALQQVLVMLVCQSSTGCVLAAVDRLQTSCCAVNQGRRRGWSGLLQGAHSLLTIVAPFKCSRGAIKR